MNNYYVINIDLVDSKKLGKLERYNVQNKLIEIIELINNLYSDHLVKELNITAGDSLQGIFKTIISHIMHT